MSTTNTAPGWYWLISIIGLLWNLLGTLAFFWYTVFMERVITPEFLAAVPEEQRLQMEQQLQMLAATPLWVNVAYGVAVFGGLLGCILLLMRRRLAVPVFGLSLAGVVAQNVYSLGIARAQEVLGATAYIVPSVVVVFGVILLLTAIKAKNEGWSR